MVVEDLNPILEYEMPESEAVAFKLALIYQELCKQYFPNESCGKLPKKGDPRKSSLFRYCYKMLQERHRALLDDQYRLFIKAQLDILSNIHIGDRHANVTPQCLVGEKAWRRWKVWLKKYNSLTAVEAKYEANASDMKIQAKLQKTKEFLIRQFAHEPTQEDIDTAIRTRTLSRWIMSGRVCPYFLLLSPHLKDRTFDGIDLSIYKPHITPEIEEFFKREFKD